MQKIYKSEIIAEILGKQGHGVPDIHYESECIDKWINDAKGSYPKLNDYESEWLDYFNYHGTGEFPYETFTGTSGTIDNVVPYAYKSAILSGQTLVNLFNKSQDRYTIEPTKNIMFESDLYKTSTTYLIKFDVVSSNANNKLMVQYYLNGQWIVNYELNIKLGINKFVITSISNQFDTIRLYYNSSYGSETVELKDIMLIEYQQGMENWDIPYFEGMQSVKMPVLKTTGKNLFDGQIIRNACLSTNGGHYNLDGAITFAKMVYVKGLKEICLSISNSHDSSMSMVYSLYDKNKNFIGRAYGNYISGTGAKFSISDDVYYLRATFHTFSTSAIGDDVDIKIQLEESLVATPYEPFKSNILTVNEDVTLRGVGDVKDELDLLTGELVQKTEKIIFDGSEAWEIISSLEKDNTIFAQCYKYTRNNTNTISNILDYVSSLDALDKRGFRFNHYFQIRLNKNEISNITNNGVKEWVSKNNIIVVRVEEQTVKTVDLTIKDQDSHPVKLKPIEGTMHIQTSGNPINPVLSCEVPVEAITQNLASFTEE